MANNKYYEKHKEEIKLKSRLYYYANKEKRIEAQKKWVAKNKHKKKQYTANEAPRARERNYIKKFGITVEEYNVILEQQKGVCKICNNPETSKNNKGEPKKLAVDHCHITGKIRGLLCIGCNIGLGQFKDNKEILSSAIKYLEENN